MASFGHCDGNTETQRHRGTKKKRGTDHL